MADQERVQRPHHHAREVQQAEAVRGTTGENKPGDKLKAELDDLLKEIDGVLEVNAEEFVKAFVQKGGQ